MLLSRPLCRPPPPPPSAKLLQLSSLSPVLPHLVHLPTGFGTPLRASLSNSPPVDRDAATAPKSAIQRIAEKLQALGYLEEGSEDDAALSGPGSAGEIFIPTPNELPKRRVGHTIDSSWSSPESPVPVPGSGPAIVRFHELRRATGRDTGKVPPTPTPPMAAELMIPAQELRRLQRLGIRLDKKLRLKVGKAGITEGIVNSIHERWRRSELVKIKCEDLCRMNMKRTHEILETKTGGLVIWRSGSIIILYRGTKYEYPYFTETESASANDEEDSTLDRSSATSARLPLIHGVGPPNKVRFQLPGEVELGEEVDRLLDGLGPRFNDWWGTGPPPVDADLLPAVVNGYRTPFRLLPFGLQPKLTDREMTILRRLSRPLPCHFALGRNRNHQGLAQSMVKLWEKCEIAKIAVKRGAQNTNTELMAEELKRLTGGTILSRDKDFIVFYRGKDFLPLAVSSAIDKRRKLELRAQKYKLQERPSTVLEVNSGAKPSVDSATDTRYEEVGLLSSNADKIEAKIASALKKKEKAERILQELEESVGPSKAELDKEGISEEERFMLRKVGLRMKTFLLMGRRGVFDGTVENMHLHWKYRELVKIISKDRSVDDVQRAALELESASGGILIAIERVSKGFAIIVYRGKNYRRPAVLRPRTLLNKKEALRRSLEAQRRESLKLHVLKLSADIDNMRHQLDKNDVKFDTRSSSSDLESSGAGFETSELGSSKICSEEEREILEDDIDDESSVSDFHSGLKEPTLQEGEMRKTPSVKPSHKVDTLSNRERLILRKQALKMKKRPIFAVGRSNDVAGVARAISAHFKKHPLAIVNVKGRAEGTSVQELVFALEEATGGVMISREPSKIILYRGWLERDRISLLEDVGRREGGAAEVSPQLMAAISFECGGSSEHDEEKYVGF